LRKKIRFGLIGAGAIAKTYLQAFSNTKLAELVAIADVNIAAANNLANQAKCPSFPSKEAMVVATDLDAVIICTPPNTHREISIYFLARQIHVLCEKPLSINISDAKAMYQKATKEGVLLTMASKFRYVEDVIKAKTLIESGILGEIILIENAFTSYVDMSSRWNSNPRISGGGVLIDNGTHSVDIMRYFLSTLKEVQAIEGRRIKGLPVEETVQVLVNSESGIMGHIDLSWSINKALEDYLRIYGTEGIIAVGWQTSKYRLISAQDWVNFGQGYDKVQAFRSQIENFTQAILKQEHLLMTSEDAIASVAVIETAYKSLKENRWLSIEKTGIEGK